MKKLTLAQKKRAALRRLRTGLPAAFVARLYSLHPSTVQKWAKVEGILLEQVRPGGGTLARMRAIVTKLEKAQAKRPPRPRCVRCKVPLPKSVLPLCVETDRGLCCSNECARRLA